MSPFIIHISRWKTRTFRASKQKKCHGCRIYFNGEEVGFNIFKEVVRRLHARYDNLIWMKQCEIARYWAARELTQITRQGNRIIFDAPFGTPRFTVRLAGAPSQPPAVAAHGVVAKPEKVQSPLWLKSGTWHQDDKGATICFDLPKGRSAIEI